jgi:hypothetical protein
MLYDINTEENIGRTYYIVKYNELYKVFYWNNYTIAHVYMTWLRIRFHL